MPLLLSVSLMNLCDFYCTVSRVSEFYDKFGLLGIM